MMKDVVNDFEQNGCTLVKNFASLEECNRLKARMKQLVDDRYCFWCLDEWDGTCECLFSTDVKEQCAEQGSSDYFFGSSNKIHYFLEPGAVDTDSGNLKPGCDKLLSLNKVGHALHVLDPVFREYSFSDKVKALVSKLGYQDPVLPQSMYILKNAKVGGEVTSHQDSTFLYTTPKLTCLGLWLALDEATEENGCLWARLGSHKEKLRKRWKRKESQGIEMEFQVFDDTEKAVLEGQTLQDVTPDHLREKGFSSLPCEAGDLVLIHGQVDHLSLANTSQKCRHTFQLHLVEGPKEGITWDAGNWLQFPARECFPSLGLPNTN